MGVQSFRPQDSVRFKNILPISSPNGSNNFYCGSASDKYVLFGGAASLVTRVGASGYMDIVNSSLGGNVVAMVQTKTGRIICAKLSSSAPLVYSDDNGDTWNTFGGTQPTTGASPGAFAVSPNNVIGYLDISTGIKRLYKSDDNGENWSFVGGIPNQITGATQSLLTYSKKFGVFILSGYGVSTLYTMTTSDLVSLSTLTAHTQSAFNGSTPRIIFERRNGDLLIGTGGGGSFPSDGPDCGIITSLIGNNNISKINAPGLKLLTAASEVHTMGELNGHLYIITERCVIREKSAGSYNFELIPNTTAAVNGNGQGFCGTIDNNLYYVASNTMFSTLHA